MKYVPRPFQREMEAFIIENNRCFLCAEMGLGKTVSVMSVLNTLYAMQPERPPTLVLAPLRVVHEVWLKEYKKWDHTKHLTVKYLPDCGYEIDRKTHIYTINYERIVQMVKTYDGDFPFEIVVADESTRLKGFRLRQGGKRTKYLGHVAHNSSVKRWINLTGTPAPNGLKDLWGQTWFIDGGARLGRTYTAFQDRFFTTGWNGYSLELREGAEASIKERLSDVALSIRTKDHFNLDLPIVSDIYVDLPQAARKIYKQMEKEMFAEFEDEVEIEAFGAAAKTTKCLQIANGFIYVAKNSAKEVHSGKIDALQSIVDEAAGANILVAYSFVHDLAMIKKAFPQAKGINDKKTVVDDWNSGKVSVLALHPASAGHGLNLQYGGNILVFLGHTWNLEERQQVIERIGPVRQKQAGFDRPVFVYNIIARDTVDELVMSRVASKRNVQDLLMDYIRRMK